MLNTVPAIIDVDVEYPERNREVVIESVSNMRHNKDVFNGFVMLMLVDVRDANVTDRITA